MNSTFIIEQAVSGNWGTVIVWSYVVALSSIFILFASGVDFYTGVRRARANGEKVYSGGFRKTINKDINYLIVFFLATFIDVLASSFPFWRLPYLSVLVGIACIVIEGKSVLENQRATKENAADIPFEIRDIIKNVSAGDLNKLINYAKQIPDPTKISDNGSTTD
jgi:hypothetical protein